MYVSLLSLFYVRCSVVTAIFALSVTVLVLFALAAFLGWLAFHSITEGVAIDTKLTRANQDLAAADRKLKAAADTARYNGETSDAYRERSNQLVDYLREVLMALELGSLVEDDPLSTPVGVLSDNASKFAQSRRLLEDCARMLGCPGDLSAVPVRLQTAIGKLTDADRTLTTLTKFLEEVESRVGRPVMATSVENRKQMAIEALDSVVATLAEKGGKLDHYRAAIDAALGGVRQDGERWSVVHIRAIEELKAQVAAKMNEAVECSLDPLCNVVFKADGVTIKHGELIGLAQRTNEALKDAKRELAESEEAGSEALEKDVIEDLKARANPPIPMGDPNSAAFGGV